MSPDIQPSTFNAAMTDHDRTRLVLLLKVKFVKLNYGFDSYLFQNANESIAIKTKVIEDQTDSIKKLKQVSLRA